MCQGTAQSKSFTDINEGPSLHTPEAGRLLFSMSHRRRPRRGGRCPPRAALMNSFPFCCGGPVVRVPGEGRPGCILEGELEF